MTDGGFDRKAPSAAELEARKAFKENNPRTAMTDQEMAQKAFNENRERLKAERLARDAALLQQK
jgi:hypothetical protein